MTDRATRRAERALLGARSAACYTLSERHWTRSTSAAGKVARRLEHKAERRLGRALCRITD